MGTKKKATKRSLANGAKTPITVLVGKKATAFLAKNKHANSVELLKAQAKHKREMRIPRFKDESIDELLEVNTFGLREPEISGITEEEANTDLLGACLRFKDLFEEEAGVLPSAEEKELREAYAAFLEEEEEVSAKISEISEIANVSQEDLMARKEELMARMATRTRIKFVGNIPGIEHTLVPPSEYDSMSASACRHVVKEEPAVYANAHLKSGECTVMDGQWLEDQRRAAAAETKPQTLVAVEAPTPHIRSPWQLLMRFIKRQWNSESSIGRKYQFPRG